MTELVIPATEALTNLVSCTDASLSNARAGTGFLQPNDPLDHPDITFGTDVNDYTANESFVTFDTSDLPADAVIDILALDMQARNIGAGSPQAELRAHTYDDTFAWVPGNSLAALSLVATMPYAEFSAGDDWPIVHWTFEDDAADHLVAGGLSQFLIVSADMVAGTDPAPGGTRRRFEDWLTYAPTLTIEYHMAGEPIVRSRRNRHRTNVQTVYGAMPKGPSGPDWTKGAKAPGKPKSGFPV